MTFKSVTLVGYHGYRNLGDDIFRRAIIRWLGSSLGVETCYVACKGYESPYDEGRVRVVPFASGWPAVARLQWMRIALNAFRSEMLIFGAGSILTIQPFVIICVLVALLKLIKGKSFRVIALGVTVGPFRRQLDRRLCLAFLKQCDVVLVRDLVSMRRLQGTGCGANFIQSYDLALLNELPISTPAGWHTAQTLGVALTRRGLGLTSEEVGAVLDVIANAIGNVARDHGALRVCVFALCTDREHGDMDVAQEMSRRLECRGVGVELVAYDGRDIDSAVGRISRCAAFVSGRLHGGIVAALCGVPVCQVSYGEKVAGVFERCGLSVGSLLNPQQVTERSLEQFLRCGLSDQPREEALETRRTLLLRGASLRRHLKAVARKLLDHRDE